MADKNSLSTDPDALLDANAAARTLGVSVRALETWRAQGAGPPYVRIGHRLVRYRRETLRVWVAQCERPSAGGAA